jgi:hypothetical protein
MTKTELERRLKAVAGIDGHGWQKAAADRLGVSDRTVRDAVKSGRVPPKLEAALVDAELGVTQIGADDWAPLAQQAGRWIFGTPETRSGERDVVAEVLLTHMAIPYFVVHLTMKAGKTADGGPVYERRVRFFEEPSSPERRAQLLRVAFEKAEARLYAEAQSGAVAFARQRMLDTIARDAKNDLDISDAHTAGLEELARAVRLRSQSDLTAERRKLEKELADLHNEQREQEARSPEPRAIARAWRDAQRAGGIRVMLQFATFSDAYLDCSVGQLVFAQHERLLPEAHLTSARGAPRKRDEPDMSRVDAELAAICRQIAASSDSWAFQHGDVSLNSAG